MQTERWRQIQELFEAAVDLEPSAAAAYLDRHSPDPALRHEVHALISNGSAAEAFFARHTRPEPFPESGEPEPGERIGPYEIIRRIGRGGMGSVFLADRADGEFRKQVAVKVIRSGLATPALLRQFRAERQMLARLDHPHIARLLDAGMTRAGLPYVIMEYVEGSAITAWCDARRSSIEERLLLFRQVCSAVHHAHQHLVVHGDIKPGNIFVNAGGAPKLLDFGIGKLLGEAEPGETRTPTGMLPRLLTPEYASPEQLRGDAVTTSSDVYSLGVLLAELLTGSRSYGVDSDEAASLRGLSPARLRRRLRGDLDTIVRTARHEQPARRYASAERFSDDIQRHLAGLPVAARPDSLSYRAGKYVRRHKAGIAATCVLVLALVAAAFLGRKGQIETARRLSALTALALADQIEFNDSVQDLPGTLAIRLTVAKRDLRYLEELLKEAPGNLEIQDTLSFYHRRLAYINYGYMRQHIGNSEAAILYAQKALDSFERAAARATPSILPAQLLHIYAQLGDLLVWTRRDFTGAGELHRKEEAVIQRMTGGKEGVVREADWQRAHLELRRARDGLQMKNPREASEHAEEAAGRFNRMIHRYRPDDDYALYRSYAYLVGAKAKVMLGDLANAKTKLDLARPDLRFAMEQHPAQVPPKAHWIGWQLASADARSRDGQCAVAIPAARKALEMARDLARLDPMSKFGEEILASSLLSSGITLELCGRTTEARTLLASAVESWEALARHDPKNEEWRAQLAESRRALGQ